MYIATQQKVKFVIGILKQLPSWRIILNNFVIFLWNIRIEREYTSKESSKFRKFIGQMISLKTQFFHTKLHVIIHPQRDSKIDIASKIDQANKMCLR